MSQGTRTLPLQLLPPDTETPYLTRHPLKEWVPLMSTSVIQSAARHSALAFAAAKAKPLILIADDSLDSREMMATLLRLKGYDVILAENGVQAIDLAFQNSPDLILMDLQLPKVDGISAARIIHRKSKLCAVPIIIVSGHDAKLYQEAALAAGCIDYLMKPIDFARLDALLEVNLSLEAVIRIPLAAS